MKTVVMASLLSVLIGAGLSGCATIDAMLGPDRLIKVDEVGRGQHCNSRNEQATLQLIGAASDAVVWQRRNNLDLTGPVQLPAGRYVVVEMGLRDNASHGFVVSPQAEVERNVVMLHATFMNAAGAGETAAGEISPCALLRLPEGNWEAVVLYDQTGKRRAETRKF